MSRISLALLLMFCATLSGAQGLQIGVFGGVSSYNGDLTDKIFPRQTRNAAFGITGTYSFTDKISARASFVYTMLGAADRFNEDSGLQARNLSFETQLYEFSLMGQYDLFSIYEKKFTPYVFGGIAVFRFDPYIFYSGKEKVYLQPLGTEGQGIDGYGEKYKRVQFAIPFGGGVKYAINDRLTIGLEGHLRKTFTDYIDDVSGYYADQADLLNARGQLAVDVSYRGDEVANGNPLYPARGAQRGGPDAKDFYYYAGFHLNFLLGGDGAGGRQKFGCPKPPAAY